MLYPLSCSENRLVTAEEEGRRRGRRGRVPILIEVTRRPHALRSNPILLAVTPLPKPLTTPPVTSTYFIFQNKQEQRNILVRERERLEERMRVWVSIVKERVRMGERDAEGGTRWEWQWEHWWALYNILILILDSWFRPTLTHKMNKAIYQKLDRGGRERERDDY